MSSRPVFQVGIAQPWYREHIVAFQWVKGQAYQQRKLCAEVFMDAAERQLATTRILEVSTYSGSSLGRELSAFNLQLSFYGYESTSVEQAYHATKVFAMGGPYRDLLSCGSSREAKHDPRLTESGRLMGFNLAQTRISLQAHSAAFDALYIAALAQNPWYLDELAHYDFFTDTAFNPQTMLATQARSASIAVALIREGITLPTDADDVYRLLHTDDLRIPTSNRQFTLF
jgi:hypothetical protein